MDPMKLGASEAAALIAEGRLTAVGLTEACLARIEARDGEVRAWAHLDPEAALDPTRRVVSRQHVLGEDLGGRQALEAEGQIGEALGHRAEGGRE